MTFGRGSVSKAQCPAAMQQRGVGYGHVRVHSLYPAVMALLLCNCQILPIVNAFRQQSFVGVSNTNRVSRSFLTASSAEDELVYVALTREDGKNEKLLRALQASKNKDRILPIELPCIEHADGPDYGKLSEALVSGGPWDYVAVTSPEAARVLASAWDSDKLISASVNNGVLPKVTAVGVATEKVLESYQIPVTFCPSKATAKVLCKELEGGEGCRVLYPASFRAQTTLQDGLTERGFEVVRLNTYDTVTAIWDDDLKTTASRCRIACFASPSAIKGWLLNTNNRIENVMAACIGETSAEACRKQGWSDDNIFYPDKPGIDGWVQAVEEAVKKINHHHVAATSS